MANITFDRDWTADDRRPAASGAFDRIARRLRAIVRLQRTNSAARTAARLVRDETSDPRMFADIGINVKKHRRYDWVGEMSRALGGGRL